MPPNSMEVPVGPDTAEFNENPVGKNNPVQRNEDNYALMIFQSCVNLLAHILIGMTFGTCILFVFSDGLPLTKTRLHILLCITGYQLLMAEAILCLSNRNGWLTKFRLLDKRLAHGVLQTLGCGLAIAGIFIKILDKTAHWETTHGKFALVALVFTTFSIVNGIASYWAHKLRRVLPGKLSKLTHVCFGTIAFAAACICLCFGLDKGLFRNWASSPVANAVISFVAILLIIVIVNPLITFYTKSMTLIKRT